MAIPSHYKLFKEHEHSYEIHDTRTKNNFHIAKAPLDLKTHGDLSKIQKFDEGTPDVQPESEAPTTRGGFGALADAASGLYDTIVNHDPYQQRAVAGENPEQINQELKGGSSSMNGPERSPASDEGDKIASDAMAQSNDKILSSQGSALSKASEVGNNPTQESVDPTSQMAGLSGMNLDKQEKVIQDAISQERNIGNQINKSQQDFAAANAERETPEQAVARYDKSGQQFLDNIQNNKIDPERYWNNKSAGSKISAALGMMLSGMGSATTGQPNLAAQTIHDAIDRDIDAQKNDQSKNMNLYKLNREALGSDIAAKAATQNQLLTTVEAKTKGMMASLGGAKAALQYAPLLQSINQQKQENYWRMGLASGGMSNMDPAQLVPMMVKNPEQQGKVYAEIQAAQNTNRMSSSILDSFEQAVKENTIMKTGAGLLRTPGSVYAFHQAMQPTFADLEGTVRQAAMDNTFKNLTPAAGDSEWTTQTKREALNNYLQSKSSAPMAKGNGLDLMKFASTAPRRNAGPAQIMHQNGVAYKKVPGGWQKEG